MLHLLADTTTVDQGAGIGPSILVILLSIFAIAIYVWMIVAIIDVLKYSDEAWEQSGQTKVLWLILTVVALFTCILITAYYWFAVRPKVRTAAGLS